ncbi:MAG: hypothetical protein IIC60_07950 [Proteobacteria bacterium]|nr:hypothetical protein [Pseudomonadota bacterium]
MYFKALAEFDQGIGNGRACPMVKGNAERILLVDAEVELLDSAKQLLGNIDYRVDAGGDSSVVLETFRHTPEANRRPIIAGSAKVKTSHIGDHLTRLS